jgi:putative proteasome-type protease
MTYCVGVKLESGLILASDSRTNAGVDNYAKFCKMTVFERPADRVLVLLSSGGLAGTQAVVTLLKQRASVEGKDSGVWTAPTMFEVANLVSDAMREINQRDAPHLEGAGMKFNASFILGGQIAGDEMRLFRIYAEGNFIEASAETNFLQTGEAKYGKPILDLGVATGATMEDATKCVLVSYDSTMLSNLSVGMPIDLICYERDSLKVTMKRRFDRGDPYFETLKQRWVSGTRKIFRELPVLEWERVESISSPSASAPAEASG